VNRQSKPGVRRKKPSLKELPDDAGVVCVVPLL
jgi:hypothetical protein